MSSSPLPPDSTHDVTLKFLSLGDHGCGIKSLHTRFTDNIFDPARWDYGIELWIKRVEQRGKKIKLQLWATPRFPSRIGLYFFRRTHVILIAVDVTNPEALNTVQKWLQVADQRAPEELKVVVGMKTDMLEPGSMDSFHQVQEYCKEAGLLFFETSSKTGSNVDQMFETLIDSVLDKIEAGHWLPDGSHGPSHILPAPKPSFWSWCNIL